jgi:hypothetical protein
MVKQNRGAILGYKPEPPPTDLPASAQRYLDNELNRIAGVLQGVLSVLSSSATLALAPTHEEPTAPMAPMIVYVDGTAWDPGSGQGYYYWNGMVWTPLG